MELFVIPVLILGISLGFFVQTIAGFAAPLVALPIMLFVQDLSEAVALMSIFFLLFSVVLVYKNWKDIDKKIVGQLAISIILGLVLGIYLLKFGNPLLLKKLLGVFIILFVVHSYFNKKKIKLFKGSGWLFGFIGGVISGLYTTSSPIFVAYLYNKLSDAKAIRATIIGILGLVNLLRVPLMAYSDILKYDIIIKSLYILPFFLLSLYLGHVFYRKISPKAFKKILMILLLLSGISLIFR
ncbi:sulfite exporter TauE/SafE family protein [Patescibacteria group bacterium]|nr:sulfite exporter TauE/SafE family protein [Patescibacteria group bacterium]